MSLLDMKLAHVHFKAYTEDALAPMPCHLLHDCNPAYILACMLLRTVVSKTLILYTC